MLYAYNDNGDRIEPTKGSKGFCGECGSELIAKCGKINIWHWSHIQGSDCTYDNDMCEWHINWQNKFPKEKQEVIVTKNNVNKIADVKDNDIVVEFQHSPISTDEIKIRERHYDDMVWVFDFTIGWYKYTDKYVTKDNWSIVELNIKKKSIWNCSKPVILETNDGISFLILDRKMKTALKFKSSNTQIMINKFINGYINILSKMDEFKILDNSFLKLDFGKYKGENIFNLLKKDRSYCRWIYNRCHVINISTGVFRFILNNNGFMNIIHRDVLKIIGDELKLKPKEMKKDYITNDGYIWYIEPRGDDGFLLKNNSDDLPFSTIV